MDGSYRKPVHPGAGPGHRVLRWSAGLTVAWLLCLGACSRAPALDSPIRTIHIIPHSHLDIGFTAPPEEVALSSSETLDEAIALAAADPDYRWTIESWWQAEQWFSRHEDHEPLLALLRTGRFGVGASYMNPHSSVMSAWSLNRLFRAPRERAAALGLDPRSAILNDVPGHPHDLPVFMSRNGVRHLVVGANQSLSKALPEAICNEPFLWEGPEGGRVLTWISTDNYTEAYMKYGLDPGTAKFFNGKRFKRIWTDMRVMEEGIADMLRWYRERDYPYDSVLALHAFDNWTAGASGRLPEAVRAWNAAHETPKLRISTPGEFFEDIEARYGDRLAVRRGGFGGQWETARLGLPTAIGRARAMEAEILRRESEGGSATRAEIDALLTFWEHSMGMGPPWPGNLNRERTLAHNIQQAAVAKSFPPYPVPAKGISVQRLPVLNEFPAPGQLYLADLFFNEITDLDPLPPEAGKHALVEALATGGWRFRYRLDRTKLPPSANVVWAWKPSAEQRRGEVSVRTAAGWYRPDQDGMEGYELDHWIVPEEIRVGTLRIRPQGPFVFSRAAKYPDWIFARVVSQNLEAEFKDEGEGRLKFDEAYPGEAPVLEFALDVITETGEDAPGGTEPKPDEGKGE